MSIRFDGQLREPLHDGDPGLPLEYLLRVRLDDGTVDTFLYRDAPREVLGNQTLRGSGYHRYPGIEEDFRHAAVRQARRYYGLP